MSISSVTASQILNVQQSSGTNRVGASQEADATGAAGQAAKRGGNAFLDSLFAALDSLGIQPAPPLQGGAASGSAVSASSSSDSSSTASVPDALNAFMQTLFQTLASGSSNSNGGGYQDVESRLQSMISSLSSASSSEGSDLQKAFATLKSAIASENSATGADSSSASSATLQSFLQTLLGNLQSRDSALSSVAASGSLLKTVA